MYKQFFGLRESPFALTPDTDYFYANTDHQDALNTLLVALQLGEGFIKVSGEVGTGKTLLCRKLLNELEDDERFVTAYIPNPAITPAALRHALAGELGLKLPRNLGQHHLIEAINTHLLEQRREGRQVVLIIDEAQALSHECLEALRLLGNLETEKNKLLQVVLLGQPELDERLARPDLRQLAQRIGFHYRLHPMRTEVVAGYLAHRLAVSGYKGPTLFDDALARRLFRASGGVPRLLNILAHKTLLACYGEGTARPARKHLIRAVSDTESIRSQIPVNRLRGLATAVGASLAMASLLWTARIG